MLYEGPHQSIWTNTYKDKQGMQDITTDRKQFRCLLTWYDSVRTRYGKLAARPSGSGAELTDREKWILDNLKFHKPYIHRVKKKTPLKGKITSATDATVDDASSSIADEESTQDMQHRHDEDIADINMVLDGREDPVATHTTISLEQMPPSSTGGKKKTHAQKMKEQDAAFLSHMKERADATAKFRAEIMATAVTPIVSSPKKLDSSRSGFCNWFESVAESLHPSLWPSFKKKITPFIVSFDAQNDKWQISSTLSTPTTQPQTQSQTQAHTSTSLHRQHDTFPSVTSAHMSQQANFDSMMSYSGTGGCHSTPLAVPAAAFPGAAPEKPAARNSSQRFVGYGAAYHGGYSESHAGSHTGTWATEDSRPPALCVHHGSSSGQSRPKSVTTSTVVSGDQDESLLDITLNDTLNIPPTTSPSELVEIGAIVKPVSAD
ncbi:unnamed protein product [Mytilus edulis]|uniref:No apical meristem-associated C-terminal domain-containing protein n=1 Tax=Mytilus edulis TaxID=6550 RepID=A0A8S3S4W4_MYTED|nr:unnamed protein product [Mytilus edulis]